MERWSTGRTALKNSLPHYGYLITMQTLLLRLLWDRRVVGLPDIQFDSLIYESDQKSCIKYLWVEYADVEQHCYTEHRGQLNKFGVSVGGDG